MHRSLPAPAKRPVRVSESIAQMVGAAALVLCVAPMTVLVWAAAAAAI